MKKIIAIVLTIVFVLSLAGCGTVNDNKVVVLWKEGDSAFVPNSLINSMDRAMYIEKVSYEYHGAKGEAETQLQQAKNAIEDDCPVLMVELVDVSIAQNIIDLAEKKNIPVVFFGSDVDVDTVSSYDRCIFVDTDDSTLTEIQGKMITEYFEKNTKKGIEKFDHNKDGKISYVKLGKVETDVKAKGVRLEEITLEGKLDPKKHELILAENDQMAFEALLQLQTLDYNTDKLSTQFVPIFTAGDEQDYKAYVLSTAPKDKKELKAHYEANKYLVDLTTVKEDELNYMIYTTSNVIASGRICGTVIEDYDGIAVAAAAVVRNLLTGKSATEGIENAKSRQVKVSYTSCVVS